MSELTTPLRSATRAAAEKHKLPAPLLYALARVESNNDEFAYRAEPAYRYLVDVQTRGPFRALTPPEIVSERAPRDFPYFPRLSSRDTEWWGQQASWGPLQVMGAVAREYGFDAHFPALCGVQGIRFGALHLARLRDRFLGKHGWQGVVAAYNAGSPVIVAGGGYKNQEYVDKVAAAGGFKFEEER